MEQAIPMEQHLRLEPGRYYHIFNRGINGTNIFLEERNYAYFLNLLYCPLTG